MENRFVSSVNKDLPLVNVFGRLPWLLITSWSASVWVLGGVRAELGTKMSYSLNDSKSLMFNSWLLQIWELYEPFLIFLHMEYLPFNM